MYKKFFMGIAAMAALTLVSCSSDDLNSLSDNSSKNEAISFDGYLGRSAVAVNGSRGSELTKTALQGLTEGFGVFGNYKNAEGLEFGSNWFDNVQVKYSSKDTKWTYSPVQYWLPQGHIDFLAYAPYDSKYDTKVTTDNQKLEFTVDPDIKKQKDLLWANSKNQKKTNNPVTFNFNHALAKIGYTVKTNVVGTTTITLNKITLAGSEDGTSNAPFYTSGTIDLSKTTGAPELWTNQQGEQKFTWFDGTKQLTSTSVFNNSDENYLFVIPQDFTGTNKLYVVVDYTITYNTGAEATMTNQVSKSLPYNFEQGKAYTINLTIGLTKIDFDVTDVNVWQEDVNNNIGIDSWN